MADNQPQHAPQKPVGPAPVPVERPVPHDPMGDHLADDRIHVGDPGAAAQQSGQARPPRSLDPAVQAPPVETDRILRIGQTYWIVGSEDLAKPRQGKIVRLSTDPGKQVGVEFVDPVGGVDRDGQPWGVTHDCDGRGKFNHCLYVRPDHVLDDRAVHAYQARRQAELNEVAEYRELDELKVGPGHSQVPTPRIAARTVGAAADAAPARG
jgi:hypothetical protein